MILLTGILKIR